MAGNGSHIGDDADRTGHGFVPQDGSDLTGQPQSEDAAIRARRAKAAAEALAEAEARRRFRPPGAPLPAEHAGPSGIEPTLHGDWMVKGRVSDF